MTTRGQARKTILLSLLVDGEPRHSDELVVLNEDYTSVPRSVRRELLRELVQDGLVASTPCPKDGRRRDYRRVRHPWELETAHHWREVADA
ncbi:MAG: hypothetical protein ACR2L4_00670 [Actinomycetota bacterium]